MATSSARTSACHLRQPGTAQEQCLPARMDDGLQPPQQRDGSVHQANDFWRGNAAQGNETRGRKEITCRCNHPTLLQLHHMCLVSVVPRPDRHLSAGSGGGAVSACHRADLATHELQRPLPANIECLEMARMRSALHSGDGGTGVDRKSFNRN
jgi:hypothetical protein